MGGDVKTKTAGYPTDAIVQLLPNATSGDWAVMTTDVTMPNGDVLKVFAWAHVRGPAVHTFIDTSGTTDLGDPQQHKDDELDVYTGTHVFRKIPKVRRPLFPYPCRRGHMPSPEQVGNDVTKAQPVIDRNNKRRQYQLRVERRWRTQAFPFRALTSMMATCFVDTYNAHCYHNKVDIDFDEACNIMFYALMHNEVDAIAAGDRDEEEEGFFDKPAGCEECDSSSDAGSDDDDVPDAPYGPGHTSHKGHIAVPLDQIPGYDGAKQQWCSVCRANGRLLKCTFACVKCSDRHSIVAVHQRGYTNGVLGKMECILDHAADPDKHARSAIEKKEKEGGASDARGRGGRGRARGRTRGNPASGGGNASGGSAGGARRAPRRSPARS